MDNSGAAGNRGHHRFGSPPDRGRRERSEPREPQIRTVEPPLKRKEDTRDETRLTEQRGRAVRLTPVAREGRPEETSRPLETRLKYDSSRRKGRREKLRKGGKKGLTSGRRNAQENKTF